jgi:hypothetical protein
LSPDSIGMGLDYRGLWSFKPITEKPVSFNFAKAK